MTKNIRNMSSAAVRLMDQLIGMSPTSSILNKHWGRLCATGNCQNYVFGNSFETILCADCYLETIAAQRGDIDVIFDAPLYLRLEPSRVNLIYTDGSAQPTNPGPAGFGVVMLAQNNDAMGNIVRSREIAVPIGVASNNQAEMRAAIHALSLIDSKVLTFPQLIRLYADSNYVVQGINQYIYKWMAKGWKTAKKEPVANQELWLQLWEQVERLNHRPHFIWTQSHNEGDGFSRHAKFNAMADELANYASLTQEGKDVKRSLE